jgi:hypothetical protein
VPRSLSFRTSLASLRLPGTLPLAAAVLTTLTVLPLVGPMGLGAARAQPTTTAPAASEAEGAFSLAQVQALVARGDAAVAAGNLSEARRLYDQAREACKRLLTFYRDISGAFRGLDARIPREMDQRGRQTIELLADVNLRLAALFRRQNQPEVAVPLLVEVLRTMTPTTDQGRRAYQQLVEIGFVTTPYTAGGGAAAGTP